MIRTYSLLLEEFFSRPSLRLLPRCDRLRSRDDDLDRDRDDLLDDSEDVLLLEYEVLRVERRRRREDGAAALWRLSYKTKAYKK